jgi:mRNA interferase MazF
VKRGEVWWYEPPDAKRRPVLILTRDEAIGRVRDVIAVPVTGTIRKLDTEVEIGISDGMPIECVLTVDNTFSAEKPFLTERITMLEMDKLAEVCATLVRATSCN